MKIKVCGITGFEQMQQLQQMGVDYAGMIFYEGSKRFVGNKMKNEKWKIRNLEILKVGVFVNEHIEIIKKTSSEYGLDVVQLHGDENMEFCSELMDKIKVIKVFRVSGKEIIEELVKPFQNACNYFLFDTDTKAYGGSGKQFNWEILRGTKIDKPFFLSGGIGLEDAGTLRQFYHPDLYAADINSRFEMEPGIKDIKKIEQFIQSINYG